MLVNNILATDVEVVLTVEADNLIDGSTCTSQTDTRIHANQLHEEPCPLTWEIEARLLAGQSDEQIADKLDLPTDVVAGYVAAFFDFRSGLDRDTWLFLYAVQGPITPGEELTEGDIWRLVAWLYGPVGVDLIIDDYRGRTDPENTDATVLAGLLRAQAVMRFVDPQTKVYAEAIRLIRKRFRRRRDHAAKEIVAHCNLLLVAAGWSIEGKGRLTNKARRDAIDELTDEQFAEQIKKAWDKIKEMR